MGSSEPSGERRSFGDGARHLWAEGNRRHVLVRKGEHVPIDLPLTAVVVGGILAPWLLGIGAAAAVILGYKIETTHPEKTVEGSSEDATPATGEAPPAEIEPGAENSGPG
jgi:hypothetical protein